MPVVEEKCVQPDKLLRRTAETRLPEQQAGGYPLLAAAAVSRCTVAAWSAAIDTPLSAGSQPHLVTSAMAAFPCSQVPRPAEDAAAGVGLASNHEAILVSRRVVIGPK
ncbi:hypothetical protein ACVLB3_003594 [Pseudarthrobacter sp. PvP022]